MTKNLCIDTQRSSVDTPMRNPPSVSSARTPLNEGSATPHHMNASEFDLNSPLNYGTPSSIGSIRTPHSGIQNTPLKVRPDIRIDKRIRTVNVGGLDTISEVDSQSETTACMGNECRHQ